VVAGGVKRFGFLRWLRRSFFTGLLVLLPVVVTAWVFYRFFRWIDGFIKPIAARYPIIDIPGLGVLSVLLIIVVAGALGGNFLGRRILHSIERGLERIPMVRTLYLTLKQTSEVFLKHDRSVFKEVVFVQYPRLGVYTVALVTSTWRFRGADGDEREYVTLFLPTTPNPTSGLLIMVPQSEVTPSHLTIEEALKMIISGGVVVPEARRGADAESAGALGAG